MPHWVALLAIVVAGWLFVAVAGGWLVGRGLGAFERRHGHETVDDVPQVEPDEVRRAA